MSNRQDDVHEMFSSLRSAESPPMSAAVREASSVEAPSTRATRHRQRISRTMALTLVGLSIGGTATAAVATNFSTSGLFGHAKADSPATRNLAPLLSGIDAQSRVPQSAMGSGGEIRGATATRNGVTVDVAVNNKRICFSPRTDSTAPNQPGCLPTTVKSDDLPSVSGHDTQRAWLTAVVPDDVTNVIVTADNGKTDTPPVTDNVAIATVSGAQRITRLSWTDSAGDRVDQDLTALPPGADPNAPVLHINHG